jgi:hypothetical protein
MHVPGHFGQARFVYGEAADPSKTAFPDWGQFSGTEPEREKNERKTRGKREKNERRL